MNVNMKKNKLLIYCSAILLSFSFAFQACTPEEVKLTENEISYFDLYKAEVNEILSLLDQGIEAQKGQKRIKFKNIFEQSIRGKYQNQEALANFDQRYEEVKSLESLEKAEEYSDFQKLIFSFNSYEEALSTLQQMLENEEGSPAQLEATYALIGIIQLFNEHPIELEEYFRTYEGEKRAKCGWWESWGECAAAIIGGAFEGAAGGCLTAGAVGLTYGALGGPVSSAKAGIIGCIGGAVVGAVAGGINGSVGNCDGCSE